MKRYLIAAALLLAGCGGLPRSLRQDIASENEKLKQAEDQLARSQKTVKENLAHAPELFQGTPVLTEWPARFRSAQSRLDNAKSDSRELAKIKSGNRETIARADRLLSDERHMRQSAVEEAQAVEAEANHWLDFQQNQPHYRAKMQSEYEAVRAVDFASTEKVIAKAGQDWPGKKADLDNRLTSLKSEQQNALAQWQATQTGSPSVATLIQAEEVLARESANLPREAAQLTAMSGQLYDAWDKVLEDLDVAHEGGDTRYREKLKIVKTHFVDVPAKKTELSNDVRWVDVSPGAYHSVENDLGMAISHKDAGLYDSEAKNIAQPPGYAYIAPPEVGSNQYGYWTHNEHGSFWTFLPQYLIMRELFWGHDYRPVVVNDYRGYYNASRLGRTYYGNETPAAPPKYGTHGTFTQQRYSGSRYVQSGGFRSSEYASRRSSSGTAPRAAPAPSRSNEGKRFGSGGGSFSPRSQPSGKRFGSGGGSRPSAPRSFGRRR